MLLCRIKSALRDRTDRRCFYNVQEIRKHGEIQVYKKVLLATYMCIYVQHGKINREIVETPGPFFHSIQYQQYNMYKLVLLRGGYTLEKCFPFINVSSSSSSCLVRQHALATKP